MSYKWETKFKAGDKVKWTYFNTIHTIVGITIQLIEDQQDEYWRKTLYAQPDGRLHSIAYILDTEDMDSVGENGIELIP